MQDDIQFLKAVFGVIEGSAYEGKRVRYNGETDDMVEHGAEGVVEFQDADGTLCVIVPGVPTPVGFEVSEVTVLDDE